MCCRLGLRFSQVKLKLKYNCSKLYGYLTFGAAPNNGRFVKTCKFNKYGFYPNAVGGSNSTYYGDYHFRASEITAADQIIGAVGGSATDGDSMGMSYFSTYANYAAWDLSATLSCKPDAIKNNIIG